MSEKCKCECSAAPKLIFACSGSADVGALADQGARKLNRDGDGKMFCTVGIGGRVSGIMKTTEAADDILAIDGCPLHCVKNSLEEAGFTKFKHLKLAELGLKKGDSEVSDENIAKVAAKGREMLQGCCK